jgi:hypothetical protein
MSADKSGSEGAKACSLGRKPQVIESPKTPRALKGRRRLSANTASCPILDGDFSCLGAARPRLGAVGPSRGPVRPPLDAGRNPVGASAPSRILIAPPRGLDRPSRGPSEPSRILVAPPQGPLGPSRGAVGPSRGANGPFRGRNQNSRGRDRPQPGRDRSAGSRPQALRATSFLSTALPSPLRGFGEIYWGAFSWGLRPRLHASAPSGPVRFCPLPLRNS